MAAVSIAKQKKPEDIVFTWQGKDKRSKTVKGEMRGSNSNLIRLELRRQGITPLRVKKKPKSLFSSGGSVKAKDIMLFTRQLCTMLNAGIAVVQCLEMLGHSSKKPKLKELILSIKNDVEGGTSFAQALAKHPLYFDDLYCSLVHAGEDAGVLEKLLDKIAVYLEKSETIKAKVKKALTYPTIVLFFAFIVTAVLLIFVIPTFESLFSGFGADLPALTKFVIELSEAFRAYWYMIFGVPVALITGFIAIRKRSKKFNEIFDKWILRVPLIGPILIVSANARFARTLSTMFDGGVPLVDAMTSVAGATGNYVFRTGVLEMRESVSIGQQLNFAMRQSSLFSDMVIQMVAIGEESGALGEMLAKVADYYEEEVDNRVDTLTTYIEPALMGFLAIVVGGLVIAMYLPIFKLAAAIS
jgi:type IV pilus assembly protein PilC